MIVGDGAKGAFSEKEGRKRKTIIEIGSKQEISPTKRGGRTYPETRSTLSKQSAGGGRTPEGIGTAEGSDKILKNPESRKQCRAAKSCC
ncbi:hypothetical protein TNCV_4067811 [Trichonephila clavipes]|nr:hypothetical protein TNCV_4067811 [Trichonephila clavipes]